jgi:hypothetical protein
MLAFKKVEDFSAAAVITYCLSHFCISEKVKTKTTSLEQCFSISGINTAVGLQRVIQ